MFEIIFVLLILVVIGLVWYEYNFIIKRDKYYRAIADFTESLDKELPNCKEIEINRDKTIPSTGVIAEELRGDKGYLEVYLRQSVRDYRHDENKEILILSLKTVIAAIENKGGRYD